MRHFKNVCVVLVLTLSFISVFAQKPSLSKNAYISLLTAEPLSSNNIISMFGHTALRVSDPELNLDFVFNYGIFDVTISEPIAYSKLFLGNLQYEMWVSSFEEHYDMVVMEDRTVVEHVFNFSQKEKDQVFHKLIEKAQSENINYYFDFFDENCTTFPRDILIKELDFNIEVPDSIAQYSYREVAKAFTSTEHPWIQLLIDFLAGKHLSGKADPVRALFIPRDLETAFKKAYIVNDDQVKKPLLLDGRIMYEATTPYVEKNCLITPFLISSILLLFLIVIVYFEIKQRKYWFYVDLILFGITGFLGVILFIYTYYFDLWYAVDDFKVLWIHPLHLLAVLLMVIPKLNYLLKYYHLLNVILLCVYLSGIFYINQDYNIAFFPLVAGMLIRSLAYLLPNFKKKNQ